VTLAGTWAAAAWLQARPALPALQALRALLPLQALLALMALAPLGVPAQLDRDHARALLRAELGRPEYQRDRPGLLERVLHWLWDQLTALLDAASQSSPGGILGIATIALLVLAGVVALRLTVGPLARSRRSQHPLLPGHVRTAAEHRAAADAEAAAGRWAEAVRERLRAVVRSLEERDLLDPAPGRTADEAAAEGGHALPACAADLRTAARRFDEIWYGGRAATPADDRLLRDLDARVVAARAPAGVAPR
jgi:Domain of unknown function (DUF4129)